MRHGHGGILLDYWNEGAWSLRAARAELGMAMALELLLRNREMRRLGRERCREEGTEGEGREGLSWWFRLPAAARGDEAELSCSGPQAATRSIRDRGRRGRLQAPGQEVEEELGIKAAAIWAAQNEGGGRRSGWWEGIPGKT